MHEYISIMNLFLIVFCIEYYFLYTSNSYKSSYDPRVMISYLLFYPLTILKFNHIVWDDQ